jgi:hypothetical protein
MNNKNNNKIIAGLLVVCAFLIGFSAKPSVGGRYSTTEQSFVQGLKAGTTDQLSISNAGVLTTSGGIVNTGTLTGVSGVFSGALSATTGTFSSYITATLGTFSGLLTSNAGHLKSYVNSTSTADTTQTLALADINMYDRIIMTPTVGATTITYPASSTLATFLPTAGDSASQCWINGTSTASQTLTFTAGTGWDFDIGSPYATTTTLSGSNISLYAIPALGKACVEYTRMPATATTFDLKAAWTFYAL